MEGTTLLGNVPNTWEQTTLGEVCASGGGDIQTGPFGSQLHASDYVEAGIPSIMPQNIGENRVSVSSIARITPDDAKRLVRYLVQVGDIVYSRRGDIEKRALIREAENGWLCGTGCLRIRVGSGAVDPLYTSYYLGHPNVKQWIARHAVGATMPNLNTSILSELPFIVPPLAEQRAIAHILGTLDDKIELNRRTNETLEATARALFQSWFVDFDPVRAKAEGRAPAGMDAATAALFPDSFEPSALGPIPRGWRVGEFGDIADITMGQSPPGDSYNEVGEGTPFYQGVRDFGARFPLRRVYCTAPTRFAERGDVLFSVRAPVGKLNIALERCAIGRGVAALRLNSEPRGFLLYLLMASASEWPKFEASGTVFGSVSRDDISTLQMLIPDARCRVGFGHLIRPLDDAYLSNEMQSRTLATLRDTLLPKLLSGEVRMS